MSFFPRLPICAGRTDKPVTVRTKQTVSGDRWVQIVTPANGLQGGENVRLAVGQGEAQDLAVHLLDEVFEDAPAAIRFLIQRAGLELVGVIRQPVPPLPTHDGSVIRFKDIDTEEWHTAVIIAGQWQYPHSGGRARPTVDWELLFDARHPLG